MYDPAAGAGGSTVNINPTQWSYNDQNYLNDDGSDAFEVTTNESDLSPGQYLASVFKVDSEGTRFVNGSDIQVADSGQILSDGYTEGGSGAKVSDTVDVLNQAGGVLASDELDYGAGNIAVNGLTFSDAGGSVDAVGGGGVDVTIIGSAATIRLGDDVNLTDNTSGSTDTTGGNSQVSIFGDGTTLTTGSGCTDGIHCVGDTVDTSGSTVNVDGDDSQATINGGNDDISGAAGSQLTIDNAGLGYDNVSGTGITVNEAAASDQVGVTNNGAGVDTVTESGAGDVLNIQNTAGGADNVAFDSTGDYAGLLGGSGYNVTGSNGTVLTWDNTNFTVAGNEDTVGTDMAVDGSITSGSSGTITGTGDTFSENGAGDQFNIANTGTSTDTVDLNGGSGDYIGLLGGSGYSVAGSNATVLTWDNTNLSVNGNNDFVGTDAAVDGSITTGSSGTLTGTSDTLAEGAGDFFTVVNNGNGTDTANEYGANDVVIAQNLQAGQEVVGFNAADDYTALSGGSGYTVNGDVSGDTANLTAGASATVNGSGGAIGIFGNDNVTASNQAITLAGGQSDVVGLIGGSGNTVYGDNAGDVANLAGGAAATVDGSGGAIGIFGTDAVAASNETISFGAGPNNTANLYGGSGNTVVNDVSGNTVNLYDGAASTVDGSGGAIGIAGNDAVAASNEAITLLGGQADTANLYGGSGNTVYNDNGGNAVNLYDGAASTVDGSGGSVGITGNDAVATSNENIILTGGQSDTANLYGGSGNTVYNDNSGNAVNLYDGAATTVDGSGGSVGITGNDAVATSNEAITLLGGQADTANLYGGSGNTVYNDNGGNAVNLYDGAASTVDGSGGSVGITGNDAVATSNENIILTGGQSDTANLYGGSGNTVYNDNGGDAVNLYDNASSTVEGTGGSVGITGNDAVATSNESVTVASGSTADVAGNSDTVNEQGAGDSVTLSGINDAVNGNNAGDATNLTNGSTAVIGGSGGLINVTGDATVTASNQAVQFNSNQPDGIALTGNGDTVTAGSNSGGSITGGNDLLSEDGSNDNFNVQNTGGGTDVVQLNGPAGDYVGLLGGTGYSVTGSNSTVLTWANTNFSVNGNYDTVGSSVAPDGSITSPSTGTVTGTGDTVNEDGANDYILVENNGNSTDTVNDNGAGAYGNEQNQAGGAIDVNFNSTGNYAGLLGGSGYAVQGSNGSVGTWDNTNFSVTGNGDTVGTDFFPDGTVASGSSGSIQGTNDTLTENGTGDVFTVNNNGAGGDTTVFQGTQDTVSLSGANNSVYGDNAGDQAALLNGSSALVNGYGGTIDVTGTASATADNENIVFNTSQPDTVGLTGSGNTVVNDNGDGNVYSSNRDQVYLANGDTDTIDGSGGRIIADGSDTVTASGEDIAFEAGQPDTVTLNGASTGNLFENDGAGDIANLDSNSVDTVYGTGGSIGINGIGVGVTAYGETVALNQSGDSVTVNGNSNTINTGNTTNDAIGLNGTGDVANVSNAAVYLDNNDNSVTVVGSNDAAYAGSNSGDTIGFTGQGGTDSATISNGTVNLNSGSESVTIAGSNDAANAGANSGDTFGFTGQGGTDSATISNGTVNLNSGGEGVTVVGSNDTANAGQNSGDTFGFTGTSDTADLSSGFVNLNQSSELVYVNGSSDTASSGYAGDTVVFAGSGENANLSNGTVDLSNTFNSATVTGSNDSAFGNTNDTIGFDGSNDKATLNNGVVNVDAANENITVVGSQNAVDSASGSDTLNIYGGSDTANVSNGTVNIDSNGISIGVNGAGDTLQGGSSDQIHIQGSNDTTKDGSSDTLYDTGSNDSSTDTNSSLTDYGGSNDTLTGAGDSSPSASSSNDNYDFTDDSDDGDFDFVFGASQAQIEAAPEAVLTSSASTTAFDPLRNGVQNAETSADYSPVASSLFEGASWQQPTLTWAFAPAAEDGQGAAPFSGAIGTEEQPVIQQAIQDWEGVSGLRLVQAADPAQADIQIGWGDFNTLASGVLGYTSYHSDGSGDLESAKVRIEDPQQNALVADQAGNLSCASTNAELYQIALHEIGHALGLADNSDPNSVMYYGSGAQNRTLDATDIAEIQSLYGPPKGASPDTGITAGQVSGTGPFDPSALVPPTSTDPHLLQHAA